MYRLHTVNFLDYTYSDDQEKQYEVLYEYHQSFHTPALATFPSRRPHRESSSTPVQRRVSISGVSEVVTVRKGQETARARVREERRG